MKIKKKTFAGIIFGIAFVMMVSISVVALWTNDVIPLQTTKPVDGNVSTDATLYPITDSNNLWGYADANGKLVIAAQYQQANFFLGDTAWVEKDGLWGAVNTKGQQVVECSYPEIYQLDDNLYKITVAVDGNTKSVYNSKGEKIFGVDSGKIGQMDGGLIAFSRAIDEVQHWGYIDTTGKVVIAPSYKSVGDVGLTHAIAQTFDDKMVLVKRSDGTETSLADNVDLTGVGSNMLLYHENGLYGYLDMSGNVAIKAQFVSANAFSSNLALVQTTDGYGLINEKGEYVVPATYGYAENIGNGYYMFGKSAISSKQIYNKDGKMILDGVVNANSWFNSYLNVETEKNTKFIQVQNGVVSNIVMPNNKDAVYYGNRICVRDVNGIAYYDLSGNLLNTYGQNFNLGDNAQMTTYRETPDAYLEICYPVVTTTNSDLQSDFADISQRLQENALSDYSSLYKDSDGSVNYIVKGSYEYAVCGSVVTALQKTEFIDEGIDEEYDVLCFDVNNGKIYNISSLFLPEVNWRTDLSKLLVTAYKKQQTEFNSGVNEEMVSTLSGKLDRNTGFLLESDGVKMFISCKDGSETVFLTYQELKPYIDQKSDLWQQMTSNSGSN